MGETCSIDDCDRKPVAHGWCPKHYYINRQMYCTIEGCTRRYRAKGFCNTHWRLNQGKDLVCEVCGDKYTGDKRSRFCSKTDCKGRHRRMPIRNALDDGNLEVILMEARKASEITPDGCWLWKFAKNNAGYPMMGQGGKAGLVHRKITEAVLGQPLGREPVHHKCARPACINPDHLQLTTHRENMAEMLQRRFYRERIADLEQALREISPDHLLLKSSR